MKVKIQNISQQFSTKMLFDFDLILYILYECLKSDIYIDASIVVLSMRLYKYLYSFSFKAYCRHPNSGPIFGI